MLLWKMLFILVVCVAMLLISVVVRRLCFVVFGMIHVGFLFGRFVVSVRVGVILLLVNVVLN